MACVEVVKVSASIEEINPFAILIPASYNALTSFHRGHFSLQKGPREKADCNRL